MMADLSNDTLGLQNQTPDPAAQEVVEAEQQAPETSHEETHTTSQDSIADKQKHLKHNQEENFRRLKEKHEAERRELEAKVKDLEAKVHKSQGLSDDDLVEGRHIIGMQQEMEKIRKQMQEAQRKSAEMADETRLKTNYTDLYNVVNEENLQKLKEVDPIAHATILNAPDLYARGHMAYQSIKKWGISDAAQNQERIDKNLAKPQVGKSPGALSQTDTYRNYLSADEKKAKWAEMKKYIGGI